MDNKLITHLSISSPSEPPVRMTPETTLSWTVCGKVIYLKTANSSMSKTLKPKLKTATTLNWPVRNKASKLKLLKTAKQITSR